jgi:Flp pilus assembly protein TadB
LPRAGIRADLALLDRPEQVHLAEQAAAAVLGAVLVPLMSGVLAVAGLDVGLAIPGWGCLLLAAGGFATPDLVTRAQAAARRADFTHALGAFLDLVVIGLAGGAGVDAALSQAARVGHGWAFDRIRHTLHTAEITRTTPWTALAELGDQLRVPVLREVAGAVGLAGTEGAKVRTSLAAKASALRLRELTAAEAAAVAATEQMSLPVIVMFAGFLVFIGYPAVVNVFTAL